MKLSLAGYYPGCQRWGIEPNLGASVQSVSKILFGGIRLSIQCGFVIVLHVLL